MGDGEGVGYGFEYYFLGLGEEYGGFLLLLIGGCGGGGGSKGVWGGSWGCVFLFDEFVDVFF